MCGLDKSPRLHEVGCSEGNLPFPQMSPETDLSLFPWLLIWPEQGDRSPGSDGADVSVDVSLSPFEGLRPSD